MLSRPPRSASYLTLQPKDSTIRDSHTLETQNYSGFIVLVSRKPLLSPVRNNPLPPTPLFLLTPNYLFNSVKMLLLLVSFPDSLPPHQQTFLHLISLGSWIPLGIPTVPPQNSGHLPVTTHITTLFCNYVTLHPVRL